MCSFAGQAGSVEVQQHAEQAGGDPPVTPAVPATPSDSLAWLPATSAAISLRLFAIDAAVIYRPGNLPGREVLPVSRLVCIASVLKIVGMRPPAESREPFLPPTGCQRNTINKHTAVEKKVCKSWSSLLRALQHYRTGMANWQACVVLGVLFGRRCTDIGTLHCLGYWAMAGPSSHQAAQRMVGYSLAQSSTSVMPMVQFDTVQ